MDQEKHFVENEQTKLITRSKARHLRRKRLNEARKARNQFLVEFINGVDEKNIQEAEVQSDIDKATLTKSKARRLRKKEKAKLLETCNCDTSLGTTGALQSEQNICTNTDDYKPNCCAKFEKYLFNSHLNNVEHFANLAQSLLSLGKQNKAVGKVEEPIECELKYTKQEGDKTQPYPTPVLSIELEDISNSFQVGTSLDIPKSKNKEEAHIKTNFGIKRSHLESCNISADQLSKTSSVSEKLYIPKYSTSVTVKQDYEAEGSKITDCTEVYKDTFLNNCVIQEKELKETIAPEICASKYGHDTNILQFTVDKSTEDLLESKKNFNQSFNDTLLTKEDINIIDSSGVPYSSLVFHRTLEQPLQTKNISDNFITQRQSCTITEEPVSIIKSETITSIKNLPISKIMDSKMATTGKTREEIKAEREARKAAKSAAKGKGKPSNVLEKQNDPKADLTLNANIKPETSKNTIPVSSDTPTIEKTLSNIVEGTDAQIKSEGKSKAELRAERRAKQEAQRAVKQEQIVEKSKLKIKSTVKVHMSKPIMSQQEQNETIAINAIADTSTNKSAKKILKQNPHEVNLFKHLYHERELALNNAPILNSKIHPAIIKLGVQYANKVIVGSNARCVGLLVAMKQLIQDFEQPSQADFIRSLEASLQESVAYLHHCRPLAVSMQNALRHLKWQMTQLASAPTDADAKNKLKSAIDTYILEQIQLADKAISITIQRKISDGNVILTYGYSSLIQKILMDAYDAGKQFRVIIADGRPWLEGKEQLRRLTKHGIECSYVLINALSFVMPEVSKVFLGAHAILANGAVMSRVGTAQVALMARAFNVPVLVACETHKSCERVQTDSIVYNELGNADELTKSMYSSTKKSLLQNWKTIKCLNLLNITYDVTPADLVSAVVTELAILPCTSVPVILRIKPSEI